MPEIRNIDKDFLQKITEIVQENISNEQFGVSELASEIGMSRSNLLRKIKKLTDLSVSQFIRNIRLQEAKNLLEEGSFTVSEVSYKVGFGSTSYFIKCFREYYGFPPGETTERKFQVETEPVDEKLLPKKKRAIPVAGTYIVIFLLAIVLFFTIKPILFKQNETEKSIAVLPFKNDSGDSTNGYFVNGLMESTLNNLQRIKELRVISRTSVEQYRNNSKSIPEIAKELGVNYLIEGSGQKIGDEILLNIQLIDAKNDKHLWAEQYKRHTDDIFTLQAEIASNIAEKIKVIISPEVIEIIEKAPTENLKAYDVFLKGTDLLNKGLPENARLALPYLKQAIELDGEFARAYAATAMAYYAIDENEGVKQFSDSINFYADKAMFYDPELPQSLIAKALFYMENSEYVLAEPYLQKALKINPNYDLVFVFLLDLYANHLPNPEKYLEYALRGLKIDVSNYDSTIASFNYLHIANAFIQTGFVEQAEKYINKSLEYDPTNLYSEYTRAFILYAKNRDLNETLDLLINTFKKDTTRLDIVQEVGKIYYYLNDYSHSYMYYKPFVDVREVYKLDIYRSEDAKIAFVFNKTGFEAEGDSLLERFKDYAENDGSVYKQINLAIYYAAQNEREKALEHLQLFSEENNYFYWSVLFTPIDPIFDDLKNDPEFIGIMNAIEKKFNTWHNQIENSLMQANLL